MIRYRYIPFTFGKPKFMSREPEPVSRVIITLRSIASWLHRSFHFRQRLCHRNKSFAHLLVPLPRNAFQLLDSRTPRPRLSVQLFPGSTSSSSSDWAKLTFARVGLILLAGLRKIVKDSSARKSTKIHTMFAMIWYVTMLKKISVYITVSTDWKESEFH